jgi:glycosyltransferase involved in cell wall biosynthesis
MRILLSAYACEPGRGSEPGTGWNMARTLAREHQVWVLTSHAHRQAIDAELGRHAEPNLHVVYLDPFSWVPDWSRRRSMWAVYLHAYAWQVWAYFVARSLHRDVEFALAHHVTYMKYSTPSFISLLPIPFFFGPVGGGESAPKAFWKDFSSRAKIYEIQRALVRRFGEWDPFVRLTLRRSRFVWATTEETAQRVRRLGARHVEVAPGVALDTAEAQSLSQLPVSPVGPMRFLGMGRLLHWKGFHLGLRAFAQAAIPDSEYWIVGEGPERQSLERMAAELGVAAHVKFWGELDREAALARIGDCHALLFPSLHDSGGWVCLEAMAAGRPVICLDLGGPAVLATNECGYLVSASDPVQAARDLAGAMTRLAADPDLRHRMGQAGQRRVANNQSWDFHAETAMREYRKVTQIAY